MRFLIALVLLFSTSCTAKEQSQADPIRVAIVDSGFTNTLGVPKCFDKDLNLTSKPLEHEHRHGDNISGLVHKYAKKANYCQIYIKYWESPKKSYSSFGFLSAIAQGADVIVFASSGRGLDPSEAFAVKLAASMGIEIIIAAGNDSKNLDEDCNIYPACLRAKTIQTVGCVTRSGEVCWFSNYGQRVTHWEVGMGRKGGGIKMSGTSQSTAVRAGKVVMDLHNSRVKK